MHYVRSTFFQYRQKENEIKEEGGLLLVGLANGKIAMLPVFEFIEVNCDFNTLFHFC